MGIRFAGGADVKVDPWRSPGLLAVGFGLLLWLVAFACYRAPGVATGLAGPRETLYLAGTAALGFLLTGLFYLAVAHAVADIRRIEADKDYALIHTRLRAHILRTTMREMENRLDPGQIVRVHRSAFLRLSTVRRVERNRRGLMGLHTEDGAVVDVGASYAKRVAAALGLPNVDPD